MSTAADVSRAAVSVAAGPLPYETARLIIVAYLDYMSEHYVGDYYIESCFGHLRDLLGEAA